MSKHRGARVVQPSQLGDYVIREGGGSWKLDLAVILGAVLLITVVTLFSLAAALGLIR